MEKLKAAYIGAVGILIILIIAIIYKGSTVLSPTVELTSKQEFVNIGEEIVADFRIYNPYREPKNYRYLKIIDTYYITTGLKDLTTQS
jgi:hypothetical protein